MIADYLITNYITLIILVVLAATMFTNRGLSIPSSKYFNIAVILIFIISIFEYLDAMTQGLTRYMPEALDLNDLIYIRLIADTAMYIIRPFIILLEIIIILPGRRNHILFTIPAVINALLFVPAAFGARFVFWIDEKNRWQATPLSDSVYIVQLIYVLSLFVLSIHHFKKKNLNLSIIISTIVILSFSIAFLESRDILSGFVTPVTSLCVLTYYIYLTSIYKQELYEQMLEKEKQITDDRMELLRSRIQPHFIYNSVNIIRTLIRTDKERAIETIDDFSDYLKAHFRNIESDDMISFEAEIDNVKAFLSLAEADRTRDINIVYDLRETDFRIPQLSLEPIIENAVRHGIDEDGRTITISSFRKDNCFVIRTVDSGKGTHITGSDQTGEAKNITSSNTVKNESGRLAIGISNTRKRLELLCDGRLEVNITPNGTTADIIIPVKDSKDTKQHS